MPIVKYKGTNANDIIQQLLNTGTLIDGTVLTVINKGQGVEFQIVPPPGTGTVTSSGMTPNQIPVATGVQNIEDSGIDVADLITDGGTPLTPGNVPVAGLTGTDLVDGPLAADLITDGGTPLTPGNVPVVGLTGTDLVDGPSLADGIVRIAKVTLTNAQVLAAFDNASGIEIIPAPGVGKCIGLIACPTVSSKIVAAYTNISSFFPPSMAFSFGSSYQGFIHQSAFLSYIQSQVTATLFGGFNASNSNCENQPLRFFTDNPGGALTGGNVGNSFIVYVPYYIITLAT